ncbi:MAG: hypothetical protein ACTSQH_00390 [Candidatus Hodarchaeales archaeon]
MNIKNLAQFKRALKNEDITKLKLVEAQTFQGKEHSKLNITRTIKSVRTNAIVFSDESMLDLIDAKLWSFDGDTITNFEPLITENNDTMQRYYDYSKQGELLLKYQIIQ